MSLWGVTQTLALCTAYRLSIAFVLLSLVCKSVFLKADEYVLDESGQLIEMPLLVSGKIIAPTLLIDVDGESCDFYEDDWCQRYGGNSSCIGLPSKQCWPRWFASASGLVMTRSLPDGGNSSGPGAPPLVVSTRSASASWPGGVDLRLGRWFGDRQEHAIEFIYWGVYNMGSSTQQQTGATNGVLSRSDTINDIEINWLYSPQKNHPEFHQGNQRVNWMWLAGFRFFQLEDQLILDVPSSLELHDSNKQQSVWWAVRREI